MTTNLTFIVLPVCEQITDWSHVVYLFFCWFCTKPTARLMYESEFFSWTSNICRSVWHFSPLSPRYTHFVKRITHHSSIWNLGGSFKVLVSHIMTTPESSYLYKWLTRGLTPKEFIQFLNVRSSLVSPKLMKTGYLSGHRKYALSKFM